MKGKKTMENNNKLNCRLEAVKRVYDGKDGKKHETTDFKLYDGNGYYVLVKPVFDKGGYYQQLKMMAGVKNEIHE